MEARVQSEAMSEFAAVLQPRPAGARLQLDPEKVKNGLGQLVLTLVKLIHELLERQALRRVDSGELRADEIERLGLTLMRQSEELDRLRREFGLTEEDLNLDLGPLGCLFARGE